VDSTTHTRGLGLLATFVAFGLAACGSDDPASPFSATDPAGPLFEPGHVVEISLEIAPGDWDALRRQTRNWWDIVAVEGGQCMVEPIPKPFTWFPASVVVDGERRDDVGVRKKGFLGSLDDERPALKVRFDDYDPDQTLRGLERLTLNNAVQDPTFLKQCLAFQVFEKAGLRVPWCNYAHVTVNGRDLGLYVNVESMDRRFLRRSFDEDGGDLWEGEFSDFRAGWIDTFELKGRVPGDDQARADRSRLREVQLALDAPSGRLQDRLGELIDFEGFMAFWATEKVLEHWDGYANQTNNFFVYDDPGSGRMVFMPWGTDQIAVADPLDGPELADRPVSVYSEGALVNRLYADHDTRWLYADHLRAVLDRAFHEEELLAEIDRMQALVAPYVPATGVEAEAWSESVEQLREWVRTRRGVLLADLEGGPPEWDQPMKRSICVDLVGSIEGSFGTTFGTKAGNADIFATGSGALSLQYRRQPYSFRRVGARAGPDENAESVPWPVVDIHGLATDDNTYTLWIGVNPERFHAGGVASFEDDAWGGIGVWNPRTWTWTYMGGFIQGEVELEQAEAVPGAPVSGRFRARVVEW
jgi:spore coat protein CotH